MTKGLSKEEKLRAEIERTEKMKEYEYQYWPSGYVCGIDEVGRGPLCGPVVAGAVILPPDTDILYLNDSKKLSAKKREELYDVIMEKAVSVGLGMTSPAVIDEINILQATYAAMREAVSHLSVVPDVLLNDAVTIPGLSMKQVPIIKGDAKSVSIAAASIVAKVTRDRMMDDYDTQYPGYGFAKNKGYGTKEHMEALKTLGPCPIHRRTFISHLDSKPSGQNRRRTGAFYEEQAALFLERHGMTILERNYRCKAGEIDIIAKQGEVYAFVEVKYRSTAEEGDALEAVDSRKRQKICTVAKWYLTEKFHSLDIPCRFDVIGIVGNRLRWIPNAFSFE